MLTISKKFTFHAAHQLYQGDLSKEENHSTYGKCANLHGHTYELQVTVSGPVNQNGMLIDFGELKTIVHNEVLSRYEHSFLNDLAEFKNRVPTVEHIISSIFSLLSPPLNKRGIQLASLTLYETPTSWATLTSDIENARTC